MRILALLIILLLAASPARAQTATPETLTLEPGWYPDQPDPPFTNDGFTLAANTAYWGGSYISTTDWRDTLAFKFWGWRFTIWRRTNTTAAQADDMIVTIDGNAVTVDNNAANAISAPVSFELAYTGVHDVLIDKANTNAYLLLIDAIYIDYAPRESTIFATPTEITFPPSPTPYTPDPSPTPYTPFPTPTEITIYPTPTEIAFLPEAEGTVEPWIVTEVYPNTEATEQVAAYSYIVTSGDQMQLTVNYAILVVQVLLLVVMIVLALVLAGKRNN
jgi:hypothetical protein